MSDTGMTYGGKVNEAVANCGDSIPLAAHRKALREAERAALTKLADRFRNGELYASGDGTLTREAELFRDREFPEPEPELRWVRVSSPNNGEYARTPDGVYLFRERGSKRHSESSLYNDADLRLLASLLPREPVAVTEAMVEKAEAAFFHDPTGDDAKSFEASMRAALEAVAADLAGPVGAEKPKAQWWGVVDNKGRLYKADSQEDAPRLASVLDRDYPSDAPHRVVGLAEVEV